METVTLAEVMALLWPESPGNRSRLRAQGRVEGFGEVPIVFMLVPFVAEPVTYLGS